MRAARALARLAGLGGLGSLGVDGTLLAYVTDCYAAVQVSELDLGSAVLAYLCHDFISSL